MAVCNRAKDYAILRDNRIIATMIRSVRNTSNPTVRGPAEGGSRVAGDLLSPAKSTPDKAKPAGRGLHDQLVKLGLLRDQDLVLHLPLRYEDHTRVVPLAALQPGVEQQAEGAVVTTDIQYRPRRQLVCLLEDGGDDGGARAQLVLRFFHFYPNQQKALAAGRRVRVFGEVREGHFGR